MLPCNQPAGAAPTDKAVTETKTETADRKTKEKSVGFFNYSKDRLKMRLPGNIASVIEKNDNTLIQYGKGQIPDGVISVGGGVLDREIWNYSLQSFNDLCLNEAGLKNLKKEEAVPPKGLSSIPDATVTRFTGFVENNDRMIQGFVISSFDGSHSWLIMVMYRDDKAKEDLISVDEIYANLEYIKEE